MGGFVKDLRLTRAGKHVLVARLLAGVPLVVVGVGHLVSPEPFKQILYAVGFPQVNAWIAPLVEILAGVLLLSGLYARIGGLLGMVTMVPACYATLRLQEMTTADLPWGLIRVPEVPHIALPVTVLLASVYVVRVGAGAWSIDQRAAPR